MMRWMCELLGAQAALSFSRTELSAFYFDIAKDRLYNAAPESVERRAVRTVLWHCLQTFTQVLYHI